MAIADLGSLTARISLDTTPLAAGAAAAKGELAGLESSGSNSLNRLASVGKAAFLGLSAAGVAVSAVSLKMASDFQSSMELVRTQAGASQVEVDRMSKAILDMAASVGTSPAKLAEALFHIESAGFRGAAALDILTIAAKGAKVGNADLEAVTNALLAVTTSHIAGVHSQAEAMGVLNAIIGVGNMRMDDLAAAIGTGILPVAKSFGLSLQDVGGALAVLSEQAIPAEVAATRLRTTIALMAAPTTEAQKALKSIGIESTDLAEAMRHGGLVEAIGLLKEHLEASGLSATEAAQLLNKAFGGGETSGTILTLLGNFDSLVEKQKQIGEGAGKFSENWEATKETFKFQMDQMKASAEVLGIRIGNFLIPIVLDLIDALNDAATWLGKHKDIALALAAVVGGPLLAAMTAFVATTLIGAAPIIAIGAAIGLLSAALVLAYEKIGPFHDAVDAVATTLRDFVTAAAPKVQQFFSNLVTQLGNAAAAFRDFARDAAPKVELAVALIVEQFSHLVSYVQSIAPQVQEAFAHILNVIKVVLVPIGAVFKGVFEAWKLAWSEFGADIRRILEVVWTTIRDLIELRIRNIRDTINFWLAVINGDWGKAWDSLKGIIAGAIEAWGVIVGNGFKILGIVFQAGWELILKAAAGALDLLVGFFKALPGRIVNALSNLGGMLVDAGKAALSGFVNGLEALVPLLFQWFRDLPGRITSAVGDALTWLKEHGRKTLQGFISGLSEKVQDVLAWFRDEFPKKIEEGMKGAPEWLKKEAPRIIGGLIQGIKDNAPMIAAGLGVIALAVALAIPAVTLTAVVMGGAIIAGLILGLVGELPRFAQTVLVEIPRALGRIALSAGGWLVDMGHKMIDGLWLGIQIAWDAVLNFFRGLPLRIIQGIGAAGAWLYNTGIDLIQGLLNGILAALEMVAGPLARLPIIKQMIDGIKSAVDSLDGAKIDITANADTADAEAALARIAGQLVGIGAYGPGGFLPPPPGYALGGLVSTPQMASLAESGPELVLPLNAPDRARQLLAQHGGPIFGRGESAGSMSSTNNWLQGATIIVQAQDPEEMQRKLEAIGRLSAMKGAA